MTENDRKMYAKGYRYRCDPVDEVASPYVGLYAKDLKMVAQIHRDWPTQRFNVVELVEEPTEADLDYAYGVHGGSKVG